MLKAYKACKLSSGHTKNPQSAHEKAIWDGWNFPTSLWDSNYPTLTWKKNWFERNRAHVSWFLHLDVLYVWQRYKQFHQMWIHITIQSKHNVKSILQQIHIVTISFMCIYILYHYSTVLASSYIIKYIIINHQFSIAKWHHKVTWQALEEFLATLERAPPLYPLRYFQSPQRVGVMVFHACET